MGDERERLRAAGLDPSSWANGPGDRYAAHSHAYDKVLVVARGSIRFGLPGARGEDPTTVELGVGDRLDLPASTTHDATVGPAGVECLEAHLAAGRLGTQPLRRPAGTW